MNTGYGKESILKIETEVKNNKTILKDSYFSAPLKIAKPFYDEEYKRMRLCMLNVSAGILAGDSYNIAIKVNKNSRLEVYTQAYGKIFQMKEGFAEQKVNINVEEGAVLEYLPHPIMPYANSSFYSKNVIKLTKTSTLIFRDIISCGRYKRDELFDFNIFKSRTEVYLEEKLVFIDNTVLEPKKQDISGIGFYEGYTHQANVLIFSKNADEALKEKITSFLTGYENIEFGATVTCSNGIIVRMLGKGSERLKDITDSLVKYLRQEGMYF